MNELKTIEDKVAKLLEKYPAFRSCDKMLLASYMTTYHSIETFRDYALSGKEIPSLESIRRVRQKLQESGLFKSNEMTKKLRNEMQEKYRNYARGV